MNPDLKAKWIAALRSGEYTQATDVLRASNFPAEGCAFCCLGVLCDVVANGDRGEWEDDEFVYDGDASDVALPYALADEAGIAIAEENHLIEMNDKHRKSFAEIADYIEAHL